MAKQVAEWEKRGAVQDEPKPAFNKPPVKLKESEISECEIQQEQIWREQRKLYLMTNFWAQGNS